MVNSDTLSPNAITEAMASGNFYATSGVILRLVNINSENV